MSNETLNGIIKRAENAQTLVELRVVVVELALALRQVTAERERAGRIVEAIGKFHDRNLRRVPYEGD